MNMVLIIFDQKKGSSSFKSNWMVWIGIAVLLTVVGGCQDESNLSNPVSPSQANQFLVGEWEWIETSSLNRLDGSILLTNPQTENKLVRYLFHQNGELKVHDGNQIFNYDYNVEINTGGDWFDSIFWLVTQSLDDGTERRETFQFDKQGQLIFFHMSVPISQSFKRIALK